jgi:hypothetical protein
VWQNSAHSRANGNPRLRVLGERSETRDPETQSAAPGSPLSRGRTEANRRLMLPRAAGADFTLCKRKRLCYSRTLARVVPGSSAVEQPAVNRLVAGSNPARGANTKFAR